MKIVYIGSNEFGAICLSKVLSSGSKVDKIIFPKNQRVNNMSKIGQTHKIKIHEYDGNVEKLKEEISVCNPELLVVASFPKLLPAEILRIPKMGVINVHPSLLPKYRGAHPINWAILHDENYVGVTIHYLDEGMDTGNILSQKSIKVSNSDNIYTLERKLASAGSTLLARTLFTISKSKVRLVGSKQVSCDASFAPKRNPENGKINWTENTRNIFNLVRASKSEYPAYCYSDSSEMVEIIKTFLDKTPGKVLAKIGIYYLISTGDGVCLIKTSKNLKIGEILK